MLVDCGILTDGQQAMGITALPRNPRGHIRVLVEGGEGDVGPPDVPYMDAVVDHQGATSDVIAAGD